MSHVICSDTAPAARVSVIIPTYRRTRFIEDAIESILAQTHTVCEIIIVDDGSEKDMVQELVTLSSLSARIRLHHLPSNRGVSAARNYGLMKATGDYLLFLDDDDLLHSRAIAEALTLLESDCSIDVVTFLYEVFFTPESAEGCHPLPLLFNLRSLQRHPLSLVDSSNYATRELLEGRPLSSFLRFLIPVHTCLVRRSSIGSTRFSEELVQGEDTHFWLSLARKGCRFKFLDKVFAYVRRHAGNKTRSKSLYYKEIPEFYLRVLKEGILRDRDDLFLVHLKLFYFFLCNWSAKSLSYLFRVCLCPDLIAKEFFYWGLKTIKFRHNLFKYYFHD